MITNIFAFCRILVFANILIVVACINVASSKGREREAEDLEQLENIRKQKRNNQLGGTFMFCPTSINKEQNT